MTEQDDSYSAVADRQLDELELADPELYRDVLEACALVFEDPSRAQILSTSIATAEGIRMRLPVPGRRHKVFWSTGGPRIEAVFPHGDSPEGHR